MAKASETNNQSQSGAIEPYFCEECKRNHTKGKIYKEHLRFAKFESADGEIEDKNEVIEISDLEPKDNSISEEEEVFDEEL
ncbi:MAG: hypothetical protein E3J90_14240, partial [Promethearchaeota archaeon]